MNGARARHYCVLLVILFLSAWSVIPAPGAEGAGQTSDASLFTVDDLLDVVSLGIGDLSRDGGFLAVTATTLRDRIGIDNSRYGDPTYMAPRLSQVYVIETRTGSTRRLFDEKKQVGNVKWSPDGTRLALFVRAGDVYEPVIWERASGNFTKVPLPEGRSISNSSDLHWTPDGGRLVFSLNTAEWRRKAAERFRYETEGPVVYHYSKEEPFLAWLQLSRMSRLRSIGIYDTAAGRTEEFLPEKRINSYDLASDGSFLTYYEDITKKTDYDVINGTDDKVQLVPLAGGEARTIIADTHGIRNILWSRDNRHYAYARQGSIYFGSVDDREARQLTGKKEEAGAKAETAAAKPGEEKPKEEERLSPVRLSPDGSRLVASSKQGLWLIDTANGSRELFLKTEEDDTEAPRYQVIDWDPKGEIIYLSYASRTEWERGLFRYSIAARKMDELIKDGRIYGGRRGGVSLSEDGSTFVFLCGEGNRPQDLYAADAGFSSVRKIMESNPQLKVKKFARTDLIQYLDADGKKLYGVLYYPVDYQAGRKYPTVFNIYEQFFDDAFNGTIADLNAHGYAVVQPSVNLVIGHPGEAWAKGVTAAANKLIEMGIADPDRLGVQGTSYGGYATNLLIAQTDRFKAAINISGKVDMISFYTDSPRLGVRNIHAPEKSQDRIGATLWEQPNKYIEHSAIMFADRIKTPLLLMTGELDSNVPARQAMEMYFALRRLDREVAWVQYTRGGHGMPTTTVDEVKDYHKRILDWYDSHLRKAAEGKETEKDRH